MARKKIKAKAPMTNNDILIRLRYALDLNDMTLQEIFSLGDHPVEFFTLKDYLRKEEEEGYKTLNHKGMDSFLDGFIVYRRGKKENQGAPSEKTELNNNVILRKLRIALELKEEDMLMIFKLADITLSRSQLSAFFRKKNQDNYMECKDQFLRNFLKGLTIKHRGKTED
jgi:uncharacterized protein YehS (DUF1456 family)